MEFFGLVLKCYQTQKLINLWALFLQRTACTSSLAWGTVLLTELFIHCVIIMKDSYFTLYSVASCCYIIVTLLCYRRILCFESSRSGVTPQKSVQAIFKALVPACSLFEDGVVMSPLLSTGNQVIKSLCVYVMYMYVFHVISVLE